MINYNEMEKVIQDLNNYVEKIQKTTESQKRIDESVEQLEKIKESISEIADNIKQYTDSIQGIESKHETLNSQVDIVLQDYKKLHSAFELLDIELKKINAKNESFENLLQATKGEIENIEKSQKLIITNQSKAIKKNKIWFGVLTGFASAILLLTIIGFFL